MQTSRTNTSRRQSWITAYRISTVLLLVILVALSVASLVRKSDVAAPAQPTAITAFQADKVAQASVFLESVGFNDPLYKGIAPATEGQYPTFQVTAIGGNSLDVWIRTTPNGGWEIQPTMLFEDVASADAFACLAQKAVLDWEGVSRLGIKPRTDGTTGEYEMRKYMYEQLRKYNPNSSYWQSPRSETWGWPSK